MAAADPAGPAPDLYELLGVPRAASREQIVMAWRRRARAEHPDSRTGDAAAPDRFRAVAQAWQVLSDPARRAAYDRTLGPPPSATAVPPPRPASGTPLVRPAGPPLWAGPVRIEGPSGGPAPDETDERKARPATLAELVLRYLAADWDQPW